MAAAIPIALLAAGTIAQEEGAKQSNRAQKRAWTGELAAQDQLDKQDQAKQQELLSTTAPAQQQANTAATAGAEQQQLQGVAKDVTAAASADASQGAPEAIKGQIQAGATSVQAGAMSLAQRLALIRARQLEAQNTSNQTTAYGINRARLASRARSRGSLLPGILDQAGHSGDDLKTGGQIAQGVGSLMFL